MALTNKGFRTPPPIEPRGPGIPKKSFPFKKGGFGGDAKDILKKEASFLGQALSKVIRGSNIPQKTVKEEKITKKRRGVFDTLLGPTPKKEKKAISPKTKSSLFGEGKVIKDSEFEKFLKDPSLYKIDQLSAHQRGQEWRKKFPRTGSGYIRRQDIKMAYKKLTHTRPKTLKEAYLRKREIRIYEKMLR